MRAPPVSFDYTQSECSTVPVSTRKPAWGDLFYDAGGGKVTTVTYSISKLRDQITTFFCDFINNVNNLT